MNVAAEPLVIGYEQDFHAWARRQADLVRARRFGELDVDNLAEEIESMGREQLTAVKSYTLQALVHMLLLQFSPATEPRAHWQDELGRFREEIDLRLEDSPSLRPRMGDVLAGMWPRARRRALDKLARNGVRTLPGECPYGIEQLLDMDWLPSHEPAR